MKTLVILLAGLSSIGGVARAEVVEITGVQTESSSSSFNLGFWGTGSSSRTAYGFDGRGSKRIVIREEDGKISAALIAHSGKEIPIKGSARAIDRAVSLGCLKMNIENDKLVNYTTTCDKSEVEEESEAVDAS